MKIKFATYPKNEYKTDFTAHNRAVTVRRLTAARLRKTAVGLTPFVRFFSATVWAGVVATQRPITCPNRQLQPERYAKCQLNIENRY
jgi:hypothetical protein